MIMLSFSCRHFAWSMTEFRSARDTTVLWVSQRFQVTLKLFCCCHRCVHSQCKSCPQPASLLQPMECFQQGRQTLTPRYALNLMTPTEKRMSKRARKPSMTQKYKLRFQQDFRRVLFNQIVNTAHSSSKGSRERLSNRAGDNLVKTIKFL